MVLLEVVNMVAVLVLLLHRKDKVVVVVLTQLIQVVIKLGKDMEVYMEVVEEVQVLMMQVK